MCKGLLCLSFGVTLLALYEQRGTCVLFTVNLNPKLPETINKFISFVSGNGSFGVFLPVLIEQVASENFAGAGERQGCESYCGLSQLNTVTESANQGKML